MDDELAARLVGFDQHHLGDPLDNGTFMTLFTVSFVVPVLALAAGWVWL